MRYNMLLEVPKDLVVSDIEQDVAWEISQLETFWPSLITPGTHISDPKKLMHCVITTDIGDVETLIKSLIIG